MSPVWLAFAFGLFLGAFCGVSVVCLLMMSRSDDDTSGGWWYGRCRQGGSLLSPAGLFAQAVVMSVFVRGYVDIRPRESGSFPTLVRPQGVRAASLCQVVANSAATRQADSRAVKRSSARFSTKGDS